MSNHQTAVQSRIFLPGRFSARVIAEACQRVLQHDVPELLGKCGWKARFAVAKMLMRLISLHACVGDQNWQRFGRMPRTFMMP